MPKIAFTGSENSRMRAVLSELDPTRHELTRAWRLLLSVEEWRFLVSYIDREMRATLELGLLARSVAQEARARNIANEEGVASFLGTTSWLRNFGLTDRDDERFLSLCGSNENAPLFLAVEALLEFAKDRMFGTVDEEYRQLLEANP